MECFDLKGKNYLVTGASSGIGRQSAISISNAGGRLVITGRNKERLEETFNALQGEEHLSIVYDLSKEENIRELVCSMDEIDGVVHSAGISPLLPAKFTRSENIREVFSVNFEAPVLICSELLKKKKIKDHASIVFVSSIASSYSYFGGTMYGSSKSALETYCRYLALEVAPRKIRCNCVAPTFVKTKMVNETEETISREKMDEFEKMQPLGFGKPEDVANTILFLLSDLSQWITGACINMGGF